MTRFFRRPLWLAGVAALALGTGGFNLPTTAASADVGGRRSEAPAAAAIDRTECLAAVEQVLWNHRIWPEANDGPKPDFAQVVDWDGLRTRADDAVRQSNALADLHDRTITPAMLQAELDRMAAASRQPAVLDEIFTALGRDPALAAECVARPALAERMLRSAHLAEAGRADEPPSFRSWWESVRSQFASQLTEPAGAAYRLPAVVGSSTPTAGPDDSWLDTPSIPNATVNTAVWTGSEMIVWGGTNNASGGKEDYGWAYNPAIDRWRTITNVGAPEERNQHTAVWTGTEMIVWGGCNRQDISFCAVNTGGRYDPVADTWTPTSTAGAPSQRVKHTALWTGSRMIVWGGCVDAEHCNDTNTGGSYDPATNTWTLTPTSGAPTSRHDHTAVWTGTEMIVWGGYDELVVLNTGGRYNPTTNTWVATSAAGAPSPRRLHTAVWASGDGLPGEMIVWGGCDNGGCIINQGNWFGDGRRYNPATNTWTLVSPAAAPSPRILHTAVWTGTEMIVFGGTRPFTVFGDGARYRRTTDSWTPITPTSPRQNHQAVWTGDEMITWGGTLRSAERYDPEADDWTPANASDPNALRSQHTAVWTGAEMIAWGGGDTPNGTFFGSGNVYTPATASWRDTSLTGAPSGRIFHTAVWTGTRMVVWGGQDGPTLFRTGGRYDPATDTWAPVTTQGAPEARGLHTAVWTGRHMIVWGGNGLSSFVLNTGGMYDPIRNRWVALPTLGAPSARYIHTAVFTGRFMIVWGGLGSSAPLNTGARFDVRTRVWSPIAQVGAPSPRYFTTSAWTGSEMVVWGGRVGTVDDPTHLNTGGRYNPVTNTWTPTATAGAPQARSNHTAVWTGEEFIVWGGWGGETVSTGQLFTGGRYSPASNTWTPTAEAGAPSARTNHTAVWTGTDMIVWGGEEDGYLNTGGHYLPGP